MATSGSKTVAIFSSWLHLKFSWEQTGQSVANNTTSISWKMQLISGNGALYRYDRTWTVTIDGEKYTGKVDVDLNKNSTQTLASGTATIAHNNDGSKTFAYSFSQNFSLTLNSGTYMGTYSGSGSDTLTTIARASQPSLVTYPNTTNNVGDFGKEFGIHMNTASQSFTHTVRYEYGDRKGTIATGVVNGTTWAVPLEFMNDIPNATSASGLIYVDTYSGSTKIGTKYTGFTVTVPASVKPTCTIQVLDNTNIQATYGSLVKGLSKLYVKTNFYAAYSSPVKAYNVTANGVKYSKNEIVTGVLSASGTTTVSATVTDKRGRTSDKASASFAVLDYSAPKINSLSVHRCVEDGTANDRGEFVKITFSASVTALNNKNSATYSVKYKKSSATSWTTLTTDVNGKTPSSLNGKYSVTDEEYIFEADGSSSFDVEVSVKDNHNTTPRRTSASTAFTLVNFGESGDSITFGGVSEEKNTFKNHLDFVQLGNSYSLASKGVSGQNGFIRMAEITIKSEWANAPIVFEFIRRGTFTPMKVNVLFQNANSANPGLETIWYEGSNYDAYLTKTEISVWDLYVKKCDAYDDITLSRWYTSKYMEDRLSITFPGDLVDTVPLGMVGYYHATPVVMRSIIDCLLPVGMIIQLYSHADPNTMYPGTSWVRMANTFLWGCDASGTIGQTGGEKTHTLTVNEIPSHDHYIRWTEPDGVAGTNTQENPLIRYGETGTGYTGVKTMKTGSGAEHNNMPPYTQVSIWRRTA